MTRPYRSILARRQRRFSPFVLISISLPVLLALIGAGVFVLPRIITHAAAAVPNMDCTIVLPDNPLSPQGLATPFRLKATNPANGPCNEANANQSAFVQGAFIDANTGQIGIYNPLVIDDGTQPAVQPTPPNIPAGAFVALWFGFNGNNLTLAGGQGALCTNGLDGSIFGQFAYCNADAFFLVANQSIAAGRLTVPPIGTAKDGKPCMTTRDFGLVDMDQSDNVTTRYLVNAKGQTAQLTAANANQLQGATPIGNPSDNALISAFVDPALGCTAWMAPNLADNGAMVPALPLNELQAAANQQAPIALVPLGDPMTLNNGQEDLLKTNLYRNGVDQAPASATVLASTTTYCQDFVNVGPARLMLDQTITKNATSPAPAVANTLFTFLAQRMNMSLGPNGLNCTGLLKIANPITLTMDANGVVTNAAITVPNAGK